VRSWIIVAGIWLASCCLFANAQPAPEGVENSIGIRLVWIPAGQFEMGSNVEPAHPVRLTKPFLLGRTEVTNAQWKRVMGNIPSKWKDDDLPVQSVTWDDAMEFCHKLSDLPAEKNAGRVYRLPTEAEWEYACRASTTSAFSFGTDESQLAQYGWFEGNSFSQIHLVEQKKPNPWGLYDMHGNVWEWCSDWYGNYGNAAETDPRGPPASGVHVIRGGSWRVAAKICRSAYRTAGPQRLDHLGFRLALTVPEAGGR